MNTPRSRKAPLALGFALACALLPVLGFGQPYSAIRYVTSGGGTSADHQYSTTGTIGQHDAAPPVLSDETYSEISGYWNPDIFASDLIIVPITTNTSASTNNNATIAITSPENNYLTTNSSITIRGTVKGIVGMQTPLLSFVQVNLIGDPLGDATLNTTNFSPVLIQINSVDQELDSSTFMQPFPVQEYRRSHSGPS
jgi:hypothetical protein